MDNDSYFIRIYKCNNKDCYVDTIVMEYKPLERQIEKARKKWEYDKWNKQMLELRVEHIKNGPKYLESYKFPSFEKV